MDGRASVLTLAESRERADLVSVLSYELELDLTRGPDRFWSRTVVRFGCRTPGAATFVELRAFRLVRATLNGRALDGSALVGNRLTLTDLPAENELVVEAEMPYVSTGEGMHRFCDPVDQQPYVGAYLGVDNAQRVFANFDQPDLKAPIKAVVTAPSEWTVVSNGRPLEKAAGRWDFAVTPALSTYLFVVVAGPLHTVTGEHRGTPFALHCRRSLAEFLDEQAPEILALTYACFDRYAELFDEPYPFDSYDQAFVPGLNWGAMESPGCITFRDEYVYRSAVTDVQRMYRGTVIAHEMAHMWFGDLVTMRWWDDLWLSESFAEYMGFEVLAAATRFTQTWTSFAMTHKVRGYDADQRPSSHPVAPHSLDVLDTERALANFDAISYEKGASLLRQLVTWLGEDVFLAGVNRFIREHLFGVATLSDLLDAFADESGHDAQSWAEQWLRTTGVDTLRLVRGNDDMPPERGSHSIEHPGLRTHRLALGRYDIRTGPFRVQLRDRITVTLPAGETSTRVELPGPPADLLLLNDGDLDFAKVRLDDRSMAAVLSCLSAVPDALGRAVLWTLARDLVREGELAASDYLTLVGRALPYEDNLVVAQGVLTFARDQVIDRYLDPRLRTEALVSFGATCRLVHPSTGERSESGLRLAAARGAVSAAVTDGDVVDLRASLDTGSVAGGTVVDSDLRWRILFRLSVLGTIGEDQIAHWLARDTGGDGPEQAARCRAALPDRGAKDAAWEVMFGAPAESEPASTYVVEATARGFWQPEQRDLLAPFTARYFDAAVEVASRRGSSVAAAVGGPGFPFHDIDPETLAGGRECLRGGSATKALARVLGDQLDDLQRALRVRAHASPGTPSLPGQ
ncbi:MAG: aminopeptidase N [Candidatus Nanopelagicales bacterium]